MTQPEPPRQPPTTWSPTKNRIVIGAAVLMVALAGFISSEIRASRLEQPFDSKPTGWLTNVRSGCTSLEVDGMVSRTPAPAGADGAGEEAGCYALAGRYGDARRVIQALPTSQARARAAWRVFNIAHPIADDGDDVAAAPMMELVLEFWPDNAQALFHAGIAEYRQGDPVKAKAHLDQFVGQYHEQNAFLSQARRVLSRIAEGQKHDVTMQLGD